MYHDHKINVLKSDYRTYSIESISSDDEYSSSDCGDL